jgi:hypothetical protein
MNEGINWTPIKFFNNKYVPASCRLVATAKCFVIFILYAICSTLDLLIISPAL